jgi:hypothetical protein
MSQTLQEKPAAKATAKFIQISSGQPFGQGLTLFALDEAGDVWQIIPDREPHEWTRLPRNAAAGLDAPRPTNRRRTARRLPRPQRPHRPAEARG